MATDRQTDANRENAQKSTGPTTAEGKARSCLNHLKSGIHATSAVIPGEDSAERQALSDRYFAQWKPMTEHERHQVDILVHCDWQARRLVRVEAQIWSRSMAGSIRRNEPNQMSEGYGLCRNSLGLIDRRTDANDRRYNRAQHEIERLQSLRREAEAAAEIAEPEPAPPPPQPAETEAPASELGSNGQNASSNGPARPESGKPVASEGPHHPVDPPKSA